MLDLGGPGLVRITCPQGDFLDADRHCVLKAAGCCSKATSQDWNAKRRGAQIRVLAPALSSRSVCKEETVHFRKACAGYEEGGTLPNFLLFQLKMQRHWRTEKFSTPC